MKLKKVFPVIAMLLIVLTGCNKKDAITGARPRVISTDPINEAVSTAINSKITATFSAAMDPSTITIANFVIEQGSSVVPGVVVYAGTTATFTPTANLAASTLYTVTISTGVKDINGLSLAKNYVSTFTTGGVSDIVPPTVTLTDPLNNATGVTLSHLIVTTFSKPIDQTTITSLTYTLKEGSSSVSGAVTSSGTTATFTPAANLAPNKIYTGTITTGVKDLTGNTLAVNYTFSFTTGNAPDLTLPMVNSTDPLNNATGVAANKVVALTFSKAMDPLTITTVTFTLKQGTTAVPGTVAYSGTTATFTPTSLLAASTIYTATITTGAKDLAGNALAASTVWSFTTVAPRVGPAPVDLLTAGNYVILAKSSIANTPISAITGDLGLSPAATSYITGFALTNATGYATSTQVTGKIYAADMAVPASTNLTTAVSDMITAYNDAAGRPTPDFSELLTGNIGGQTLVPGLYKWTSSVTLPTDVTISGGANDVWIFQISQDLTVSNAVKVTLAGNAQAKNIFWQVSGTVTLGTSSHFEGIILSKTGITFQTGASFKGRALAQTAVILDANTVVLP